MTKETFKTIPGYEGLYEISDKGNVKSLNYHGHLGNERILKPHLSNGYFCINLNKDKKQKRKTFGIHQLMAITFLDHIPCGYKLVVDHIDNNPRNNNLSNLQVITNRENCSKDQKGYSSKYTGVCWDKQTKKWLSRIVIGNKRKYLGHFENEIDAHEAYQNKLKEILNNNG